MPTTKPYQEPFETYRRSIRALRANIWESVIMPNRFKHKLTARHLTKLQTHLIKEGSPICLTMTLQGVRLLNDGAYLNALQSFDKARNGIYAAARYVNQSQLSRELDWLSALASYGYSQDNRPLLELAANMQSQAREDAVKSFDSRYSQSVRTDIIRAALTV